MASLHCECQELKPKVETNSSFLVLHPSSGVDTVNTVGSHLNRSDEDCFFSCNMYGLLTKCEVKMAGYWPSSFLRVYGPRRT